VGILRLSGPQASEVAAALTRRPLPPPRVAALRRLVDPATGETLDRGLVVRFASPASYTGEDVVELHHHGGAAVLDALARILRRWPKVRPALPGELTKRAFLNGRLDLTQAEAVADLVEAETGAQRRQALRQLDGDLGREVEGWRATLLDALARIEAEIDFAAEEGDVGEGLLAPLRPGLASTLAQIESALGTATAAERLREGLTVAVIGAPNVGKSSLVNLLARRDVAIVSEVPGTTRDVIEVRLDLDGWPVTLLDTAGLRDSEDPIERLGVARARQRAAAADLRVLVLDATDPRSARLADAELVVANKVDLAPAPAGALALSCRTGQGIDALLAALATNAAALMAAEGGAVPTRERHRAALLAVQDALGRVLAAPPATELALIAEDLRLAVRGLGRITGSVDVEDVLDLIFARFFMGK